MRRILSLIEAGGEQIIVTFNSLNGSSIIEVNRFVGTL
jgi:fructose-1,6-bisphosphatase